MPLELKLQKIGDSVGLVLPEEALAHLKADEGSSVVLTETPEGFLVSASDPEHTKTMEVFQDLSARYCHTLRKLAN